MNDCFQCQLERLRLRSIPCSAGRWGKFLSCVIAGMWAGMFWGNRPGMAQMPGMEPIIILLRIFGAMLGSLA
jgi:hypothetical protein